eukprot:TRINITY_DN1159_c0_g1_i3.p1 TRINITY_DN1159_c0_g1~~TRINITY_DN1159_c0_g1_i3.p1  ORF type:complete len:560 (-),score=98.96 TRINITY_DN1159_c0_g1_i3:112-1791(-)
MKYVFSLSVKPNEMRPVDWLLFHSIRYFCRNSKEKEDLFLVLYEFVRKYNPKSVVDLLNKSTSSLTRACGKLVMVFDEAQNMLDGTFYLPQRGDKTPNVATTTEGGRPIISAVSRSVGELSVAASKNVRLLIAGTGIRLRLPDFVTTAIAKLELTSKVLYEFGFYSDAEELNEYLSIFLDLSSISIPQCLKDLMKRIVPGRYRFAASLIAALLTSNEPEDCVTEAFTKRLFNDEEEVGICHMLYNIWKNDPDHRPTFPTAPIHKAMELTRAFKVFGSHFVFSDEEEIALVEQGICMIQNDEDSLSGCMCEPLVADACNEFFKKWFNQDVFDLVKGLMGRLQLFSPTCGLLFESVAFGELAKLLQGSETLADNPLLSDLRKLRKLPVWAEQAKLLWSKQPELVIHGNPVCPTLCEMLTTASENVSAPVVYCPENPARLDGVFPLACTDGPRLAFVEVKFRANESAATVARHRKVCSLSGIYTTRRGTVNKTFAKRRRKVTQLLKEKFRADEGLLRVLLTYDTPAQVVRADIEGGDVVLVVDARQVFGATLQRFLDAIKGE